MIAQEIYIGCAGWSIPKIQTAQFPGEGSHLERYATQLSAVEINSSFYRPHQPKTYERWANTVPEPFRFAVKMPKAITHICRLDGATSALESFLHEISHLGPKLGPVLIQLPPSLAFQPRVARAFFEALRQQFDGQVVCEPRHPSWFSSETDQCLVHHQIARVAADPAVVPQAAQPGGWPNLIYYRLHGSPQRYSSAYSPEYLIHLAHSLREHQAPTWCIFDNTAAGAALPNALFLGNQYFAD